MAHNAGVDRVRLSDSDALIPGLTDDVALNCLARVNVPDDFGSLSCLNTKFNKLVKSRYLYELRKQLGIVDHWLYVMFFCTERQMQYWEVFDPVSKMWLRLPDIPSEQGIKYLAKKMIVVGSELLVFRWDTAKLTVVMWKYDVVHQTWATCTGVNYPCEFHGVASSSYGSIAIVAGGADQRERAVSNKAAIYDSSTGKWEMLPNMNTCRQKSAGVFMDGKFYVIGGVGIDDVPLSCGEEFDLETRKWRKIEGMYQNMTVEAHAKRSSPLAVVVDNELYALDFLAWMLIKYDKKKIRWDAFGMPPVEADSSFIATYTLKAVGDELMMLTWYAGPQDFVSSVLKFWSPDSGVNDGPLDWKCVGLKTLGNKIVFVADNTFH